MHAIRQTEPTADARPGAVQAAAPAASYGQWVEERPSPGLAQGKYPWPGWGVAVLGGVMVALGLVYLAIKVRQLLRR